MDRLMGPARLGAATIRTPVYRTAGLLIASEAVSATLGLGFWVLVARLYPDADAGVGSVLITTATLLATASTLGLTFGLIRFLPEHRGREAAMINSSATVSILVALALGAAFALGSGLWFPVVGFLGRDPAAFVTFVAFVAVWSAYLVFDAAFLGVGAAGSVLVRALVYGVMKVALPLALIPALPVPLGLYSAWGFGLLTANVLAVAFLVPRAVSGFVPRPQLRRDAIAPMLRYAVGSHATTLFGALPGLVFPLLIVQVLPAQNAVYFYVAWSIASVLYLIPGSVFLSVFAEGSRAARSLRRNTWGGLVLTLALLAPAVVATLLLGSPVLTLVFRASYAPAVPVLNVLAVSSFLLTVNLAYVASLRVHGRLVRLLVLIASTSVGALGLGWALLPAAGLMGAALGFAAVQGAMSVVSAREMVRDGTFSLRTAPVPKG